MLGRSMLDYLAPEDRERAQANVGLMFEGVFPGPEEYVAVRTDGSRFPLEINGEFIRDAEGRPVGMVFVARDITERKRAEDEIRRLNAELEARVVSRTEQRDAATRELEAFAYSVSHDVRTPLRTIDGFSAAVMEDEAERLSPDGIAALGRVRGAAQTLARLLDDLMGLSHVSRRELTRQLVDLTESGGRGRRGDGGRPCIPHGGAPGGARSHRACGPGHGAADPARAARQRVEVHGARRARARGGGRAGPRGRARLLRARRRRRLRPEPRGPPLRSVPAHARRRTTSRATASVSPRCSAW